MCINIITTEHLKNHIWLDLPPFPNFLISPPSSPVFDHPLSQIDAWVWSHGPELGKPTRGSTRKSEWFSFAEQLSKGKSSSVQDEAWTVPSLYARILGSLTLLAASGWEDSFHSEDGAQLPAVS